MSRAAAEILENALQLGEEERLELASELIASVDGPADSGWEAAWVAEVVQRERAAAERGLPAPEWRAVRARILSRLVED